MGTFKPQRFSPKKNNVRQNWFNGEEGVAEDGSGRLKAFFYIVMYSNLFLGNNLEVILN